MRLACATCGVVHKRCWKLLTHTFFHLSSFCELLFTHIFSKKLRPPFGCRHLDQPQSITPSHNKSLLLAGLNALVVSKTFIDQSTVKLQIQSTIGSCRNGQFRPIWSIISPHFPSLYLSTQNNDPALKHVALKANDGKAGDWCVEYQE